MPGDTIHRFGDEYLTPSDWGLSAPDTIRRVALALGSEPLEDARHLLAPILQEIPASPAPSALSGPESATAFVLEVFGSRPATLLSVVQILTPEMRADLDFPRSWGRAPQAAGPVSQASWFPLPVSVLDSDLPMGGIALAWELSGLVSEGGEAIRDLEGYIRRAAGRFAP
ncbi:MAG: hypothetical protein H7Z41_15180, partial [Cytophagales bacterium]|nr:hypothetical protein [Armatimonadota bacterium]